MFRQDGRTEGTAADAAGVLAEDEALPAATVDVATVAAAEAPTMMVDAGMMEVLVRKTVERVDVVSKLVTPPVVWVRVTGQMVVEAWMLCYISRVYQK